MFSGVLEGLLKFPNATYMVAEICFFAMVLIIEFRGSTIGSTVN
jgi:hypothetical protein